MSWKIYWKVKKFWCDALELAYQTDLLQIAAFSEATQNNVTGNNQ